ncbi:helix-hairpin-helix domain-containing protein [Comamonas sp.]|uniref:helix-hairpin-helix domain-containing protein n=1 Tax=Comamonas sp. TaxID=34028 RepID=UPI003916D4A1
MLRFRQIEAVFFPGESFTPPKIHSPPRHVKGSSLNGALSPAVVRALARGGITTADQLFATGRKELLSIEGLGPTKLREIESVFFLDQH